MGTPATTDGAVVVELAEEFDGDEIGSRNYRFSKIGEPVSINFEFDPQCLPSQPLAISERLRLLFVAYPQGFYVARTKDVIAAAEEIKEKQKGPSIQDLSIADVPIGKVSILALSADDSLLAATVDSHVHFFAVSALLHKDKKPSYSVRLDDSSCIKDVRWAKKVPKAYLVLSDNGKLYHGSGQGPLVFVMEGVDSVDWSLEDNFVALAKKNTVSILSSELKEKLRYLLPFRSVVGDSDVNQSVKVDSVRWIRPDCIAVGCFHINDDGEEENYVVQVLTSMGGSLTEAASKPNVLSFSNVFMDFCPDAVPTRTGPHLILNYLDLYGLAFIANRNLSQSVGLFCWSPDSGKNAAAMVEILNDAWNLYIDSQDNGEENVILGLSVDKVSHNENARFTLGDEDTEVSPCCVIICLTIDGKISVFHFASAAGALVSPESCTIDEEAGTSQVLVNHELPLISSTGGEESKYPTLSTSKSREFEVQSTDAKATTTNDLSSSSNVNVKSREQSTTENMGHKALVYSPAVNVDKPEKSLSFVLNKDSNAVLNKDSNAENHSISAVKRSTGSFSEKVIGDSSRQSITKDPIPGCNREPLHKSPPISNSWSLTRSSVRNDTSKTSDGLQSSVHIPQDPADLTENIKPPGTFTSFGQTASTGQGHRNSMSAYSGLQVSLGESVASGKPFQSEFKKDLNLSSYPTGLPYSAQKASKQFGIVEEMAKKLDILLEGIEGKDGFVDASITSQTKSVMELEDGIWSLSGRCRTMKGLMNEQLKEIQLLLDKTIQVSVRKVYMEGVFKQATDSRYLELWNRQKLSSELELKQKHILELNQELTNKLIELERHFNTLEFNKFGENGGTQRNPRVRENKHSRQTQSLHSLHNSTQAQLAAAEQLSGCLSKQMSALSIKPSEKLDVKKKLFESIGLSYTGDDEKSPVRVTTSTTPLNKEHLITSNSVASNEHFRRNQASFAKSPETARRRRDSLDRSWVSFEPPKTTVKRALKEYNDQGNANQSSLLNIDKQYLSQSRKKPEVPPHSANSSSFRASLNSYKSKGNAVIPEQNTEIPLPSLGNGVQVSSTKSSSRLETRDTRNSERAASKLNDEKSKSSLPFSGKNDSFAAGESNLTHKQSRESMILSPFASTETLDHFKHGLTKSTPGDQRKITRTVSKTPSFDFKTPVSPASAFNSSTNVSEKTSQPNNSTASIPSQSLFGSSLITSNSVPSFASSVSKPISSISSHVANLEESQPRTSIPPTLNFASDSLTSSSNPPVAMLGSKTETKISVDNTQPESEKDVKIHASASQPGFSNSTSSAPTELSNVSKLGSQLDSGGLSKNPSVTTTITAAEALSPLAQSSEGYIDSLKNNVPNSSDEEEMEEEAPETNQVNNLSLGILGGFGLGSAPNSTAPKSNPFGVSTFNKDATFASSPYTMPASSGELFRPASFSFQPSQLTVPSQPTTGNFSGGFGSGNSGQVSVGSGFGQPANVGAGQQALGSVLGSFGQSRQIGAALPGINVAPASGFGGGFGGISPGGFGGGFATASASGGGFASLAAGGGGGFGSASGGGGFPFAGSGGGGFASASGGGFASLAAGGGGGFAAAAAPTMGSNPGGGFGAFGNQQGGGGGGGFSAFGGSSGVARPPSELFTQMRK